MTAEEHEQLAYNALHKAIEMVSSTLNVLSLALH